MRRGQRKGQIGQTDCPEKKCLIMKSVSWLLAASLVAIVTAEHEVPDSIPGSVQVILNFSVRKFSVSARSLRLMENTVRQYQRVELRVTLGEIQTNHAIRRPY